MTVLLAAAAAYALGILSGLVVTGPDRPDHTPIDALITATREDR